MNNTHSSNNTVFLALGSNLGNREAMLESVRLALPPKVQVLEVSPVYETEPWGYADQPDYLNQVIRVSTELSPLHLLRYIKKIEARIGRKVSIRYGPRVIDIDILLYNDLIYKSAALTIPHPDIPVRAFVLVPLCDIAPFLLHPVLGKTISELIQDVDRSTVRLFVNVDNEMLL